MDWIDKLDDEQLTNLEMVFAAADKYKIPANLLAGLAYRESKLRSNAMSEKDEKGNYAYGPMQLRMPAATDMKVDRQNVQQNIDGGARYFKQQLDKFGDPSIALLAYHAGPNHEIVMKDVPIPDNYKQYVKDIEQHSGLDFNNPLPSPSADAANASGTPPGNANSSGAGAGGSGDQSNEYSGASTLAGVLGTGAGVVAGPLMGEAADWNRARQDAAEKLKYETAMKLRNDALAARDALYTPVEKYSVSQGHELRGAKTYEDSYKREEGTRKGAKWVDPNTGEEIQPTFRVAKKPIIEHPANKIVIPPMPIAPTPQPGGLFNKAVRGSARAGLGGFGGGMAGLQGSDALERAERGDTLGAALAATSSGAGAITTMPLGPKARILTGLTSLGAAGAKHGLDYLREQQQPGVTNKADGGLINLQSGGSPKRQLAGKAVDTAAGLIGRQPSGLFVPRETKIMRMSEALAPHEGKYLGLTQTDNFGVHGTRMGGNQFPNFQNINPLHQRAGIVWMNDAEKHANALVNNRRFNNKDVVYSTYIGAPDQLKSNKTVTNDILNAHYNRNLTPEQVELINNRIATVKDSKGRLIFPQAFDIRDRFATQELGTDTFARRGALASMLGEGEGVGRTKQGIALPQYQDILRSHRDPLTEGVPTSSVGTRIFTVDDRPAMFTQEFHPDYNWGVFGKDQQVQFPPVPQRLAVHDWHSKYKEKYPNREPHGNAWFNYPTDPQFIDEAYLTRLQKEGYAQGGLTGYAGKGESLVRAGKAGLERFLAPSQEKGRMYHGTRADIQGFSPNVRGATYLSPDPKFANRFAAQTDDPKVGEAVGPNPKIVEGANVMPVHVQATNIYDPLNEKQSEAMRAHLLNKHKDIFEQQDVRRMMAESADKYENWRQMEHPLMQGGLKDLGHDAFYVNERGVRNLGVYDPKRIKSAIGNQGAYDTNVNDLTKAEGGLVHLQSGGNPKLALMKALASKALPAAERDANLQKFLLPSQEKRRMYHGTQGNISKFNPNNGVHFLTPDPAFANTFAAKSFDLMEGQSLGRNPVVKPGANVMPLHVQAKNIFDPSNRSHLIAIRNQLLKDHGGAAVENEINAMVRGLQDSQQNWVAMENPMIQNAIKDLGHDAFRVRESGVENLGVYNAGKIKSAIGNEGTYNTRDLDVTKAEGGLVHLQSGGNPKAQIAKRLVGSTYDMLGLTPESVAAWRKTNAKPYKQQQDPRLAQVLDAYLNKQISQEEYLRAMNQIRPIHPLTAVPGSHSNVDIASALDQTKAEKGILGLNLQVPEGTRVGNRLDIPAYERYGVYVDTMHDPAGKPIGYGHTGRLKDVEFKSSPTRAARVGLGTKEQALTPLSEAEGQGKSPFAMMVGNQVNTSDDEVRRMLQEYLRDPEWHQIGMNPYRGSQFYDKADMMPVWSAKEKLQAGPLVLARDIEKTDWTDPRLMTEFGVNYKEGGPTGLYANIHAKQERIKHGSGEKMRKPGSPGAPTADAFEESAKTAKLKDGGTPSLSVGRGEKLSTDQGAGLTAKGRAKYNRETGSNLKAPQPEGGARKDSFCARMQGVVDHAKGDAPRAKASLKRWNC